MSRHKRLVNVQHTRCATFRAPRGRTDAPRNTKIRDVMRLPLIVREPLWIRFAGRSYSLRLEGLYRFWDLAAVRYGRDGDKAPHIRPTRRYAAVIRYRHDVIALLAALAQLHVFGTRHDAWPHERLIAHLRRGMISMTCGPSTQLFVTLLRQCGVPARHVAIVRRGGRRDGYSDGHVLMEYHCPQLRRWVMFDPVGHHHFIHRGRRLDAGDVAERVRCGGDVAIERITPDGVGGVDTTEAVLGEFPEAAMSEYSWQQCLTDGVRDMLPLPGIARDGTRWYTTASRAERRRVLATSPDNRVITRDEWRSILYTDVIDEWRTPGLKHE